jgi:hypothetical protein
MFRIWGKIFKDNHLVRDMVYENGDTDINRTKKVFAGIHAFAEAFDLQQPIWLDKNINEFKRVDKTRFEQDNFIEQIRLPRNRSNRRIAKPKNSKNPKEVN